MTDRLTPEREAEIRGTHREKTMDAMAYTLAVCLGEVLAELDAVRRERDTLSRSRSLVDLRPDHHLLEGDDFPLPGADLMAEFKKRFPDGIPHLGDDRVGREVDGGPAIGEQGDKLPPPSPASAPSLTPGLDRVKLTKLRWLAKDDQLPFADDQRLVTWAADTIDALRQRVEAVEFALNEALGAQEGLMLAHDQEIDALRARNEELRAMLENHQWSGRHAPYNVESCPECGAHRYAPNDPLRHESDHAHWCELGALLQTEDETG